ncbi:MAG: response regulator [Acidobacteria bacterium]|nr:response regulator [Acidobacteriota bacterium]
MAEKGSGRILLVDDLALYRRVVPARLGALGREVDACANAEEARSYLARRRPELILLDVIMPGTDGLTFCRELKEDPRTRDIPVLMLTDLRGNAHERSLEAGADDYLPKRLDDALFRIRVQLHLHLVDLRRRDGGAPSPSVPAPILVATRSPLLRAQLPAQFSGGGHTTRLVDQLEDVPLALMPEDRLVVMDMELGVEEMHAAVSQIRMEPTTAGLPVLLLCEKEELSHLLAIEFMIDDVLWKPLKAQVTRHRLALLLELARRTFREG